MPELIFRGESDFKVLPVHIQILKCGKGTTVGTNELHSGSFSGQMNYSVGHSRDKQMIYTSGTVTWRRVFLSSLSFLIFLEVRYSRFFKDSYFSVKF